MRTIMQNVPALILIGAIVIPALTYAVLGVGERMLSLVQPRAARRFRPWLWLVLPLALVGAMLVYPLISTIVYAFANSSAAGWAGFSNFAWAFTGTMRQVLGTSVIWVIALPVGTVVLALVVGVLFDRVRYERLAMAIIVLPTAISFTAASIIWRQIYSYQPAGTPQLGLLNALITLFPNVKPVPWLLTPTVNTACLIFVALWSGLGVAALILSAAIKNVPQELVEAAKLDGAGALRIFMTITLPEIWSSVLVVLTTQVISALKIFDIVYVMTDGNYGTDVISNRMYTELFVNNDLGHASAIAVILLVAALPVVFINIRQFRQESAA